MPITLSFGLSRDGIHLMRSVADIQEGLSSQKRYWLLCIEKGVRSKGELRSLPDGNGFGALAGKCHSPHL